MGGWEAKTEDQRNGALLFIQSFIHASIPNARGYPLPEALSLTTPAPLSKG